MLKQKPLQYVLFASSLLLYLVMAYGIQRYQTIPLFICYFSLFYLYIRILLKHDRIQEKEFNFWMLAAIFFRAGLLFSVPALSDDFYRFIWDGRLLAAGYHPFAEVPSFYMTDTFSIPGIDAEIFDKLNSKDRFTIYPPVCQFIFWISAVLSPGSVYGSMVVMKIIIFSFEMATLWIFTKIIRHFNRSVKGVLIYALNPLVILELTGNLHFEGIMIFFLLLGIFLLIRMQSLPSVLAYSLSICTKLIPLLFLPLMLRSLGWKKAFTYWVLAGLITALLFLPLLNTAIIHGFSTSLGYYFQRFEFNASIYYLIREAGYWIVGFNIIQYAGPALGLIAAILIVILSFRNVRANQPAGIDKEFVTGMLWSLLLYFLLTTILHPWYIITLLAIGILTPFRFPIVWSGMIFLTYAGYTETSFQENLLLVAVEYLTVFGYLLYETAWMKRQKLS